jgi:EAL domain-containing protein (putative c-di-GMP-specific phosphodiesterase class I)/FixJ family two-component response regulator
MEMNKALPILLVDDDSFTLKLLSRILAQLGFTSVITAENGETALRQLADSADTPQLILLDLNMPEMDGVEFVRSLVELDYSGSLIFASGETERVVESVAKLAHVQGLHVLGNLQKPVTPKALVELLESGSPPSSNRGKYKHRTVYDAQTLQTAIAAGELINYYQPKVSLQSGAFVGVEVLVRWLHPRDGLVYPDQFIPIAEEHGMIHDLTRVVLTQALHQVKAWEDAGLRVKPAINISMYDLNSLQFPDNLSRLAQDAKVPLNEIMLEVTESQLMPNLVSVLDILSRLRLKRVSLAIDDFGTGYSSLAQLRDFPFDQLKIDKRFVSGAHADPTARAIFVTCQDMGQRLSMEIVAEGVESRADWDWLREAQCDIAQGYFIARPMPAEALPEWLSQWRQRIDSEHLLPGRSTTN